MNNVLRKSLFRGFWLLGIGAALLAPTSSVQAGGPLGLGVGGAVPNAGERLFADAMKTSRGPWRSISDLSVEVAEDGTNSPLSDAQIVVWDGVGEIAGTYRLVFKGKATVSNSRGAAFSGGYTENGVNYTGTYNSTTNTTTATVTLTEPSGTPAFVLSFRNTRRNGALALGASGNGGISDVRFMRPNALGSATPYAETTTFTSQIKTGLSKVSVLRVMDLTNTNANETVNWADRTLPAGRQFRFFNGYKAGAAWEYAVQLANETNRDLWICIPAMASGNSPTQTGSYIYKLAQLIRNGSDGVQPYANGYTGTKTYPGLASGRKLYVEFSNEVWNPGTPFTQNRQNKSAALAEVAAGNSPLAYDGTTSSEEFRLARRRVGKRIKEISDIFRAVWGDAAMPPNANATVRPVLMWQYGNSSQTASDPLTFLHEFYGNGNGQTNVSTPRDVNYYLWAGGGAFYSTLNDISGPTIDDWYASGLNESGRFPSTVRLDVAWARAYGLKTNLYEGGFQVGGDPFGVATSYTAQQLEANRDPRARGLENRTLRLVEEAGVDLTVIFNAAGDSPFGRLNPSSYSNATNTGLNAPKVLAINDTNARAPYAITYGKALASPLNINAATQNDALLTEYRTGRARIQIGSNPVATVIYVLRNTGAGASYNLSVTAKNAAAGGKIQAYCEGKKVGAPFSVPGGNLATTISVGGIWMKPGLNVLRFDPVVNGSGITYAGEITTISLSAASTTTASGSGS